MFSAFVLAGLLLLTAGTTDPSADLVVTYLESTFSTDPAPALAVASPNSDAARYAIHQSAFAEAVVSAGYGWEPATVAAHESGEYRMCQVDQCATFADISIDEAGLVSSFTVEGANPGERLGSQTEEPATSGPLTARVRSSFRSERSDGLIVTVELATEADVNMALFSAVYIGPDGRQVTVSFEGSFAPEELFAGANSVAALTFPGGDLGGTLRFEALSQDFADEYTFALDVPVFVAATPAPVATTEA